MACLLLLSRPRESLNVEKLKESNSYNDSSEVPILDIGHCSVILMATGPRRSSSCPGSGEGVYRTRPCNNR